MAEQSYSYARSVMAATAVSLANQTAVYTPVLGCSFKIIQVFFKCATDITTTDTLIVKRNKTALATTNNVTIGTVAIPTTVDLDDIVRANFNTFGDTDLGPGESISFEATAGTGVGTGYCGVWGFEYYDGPNPAASFTRLAKTNSGTGYITYAAATEV